MKCLEIEVLMHGRVQKVAKTTSITSEYKKMLIFTIFWSTGAKIY